MFTRAFGLLFRVLLGRIPKVLRTKEALVIRYKRDYPIYV